MSGNRNLFSKTMGVVLVFFCGAIWDRSTCGQDSTPYLYTDPATGIQYRKEYETLERPMIRQASETREIATMQAKVVRQWEMVPATQYVAVQREVWHPQWRGVWNPLAPATLHFKPKAEVVWEARPVMTPRATDYTQWVEHRETIEIPKNYASIHREQVERWVAVGPGEADGVARLASVSPQNAMNAHANDGREVSQVAGFPQVASAPRMADSLPATVLSPSPQRASQGAQPITQPTVFR